MSVSKLPNNRWRAQVSHEGKNLSVPKIIGGPKSYPTKREAKAARAKAREALGKTSGEAITVRGFWERWTTDPLFARPKDSTNLHNHERTKAFVERYGDIPLERIDGRIVGIWLAGGKRTGMVPALRAMFNDAASPEAGELIERNPFAGRRGKKTRGLRDVHPPSEEMVWSLIRAARKAAPGFASWLQVAAHTGMRPGELDALRWDRVDFEHDLVDVVEQWNPTTKTFTTPKNGKPRPAILTPVARQALLNTPHEAEFCFVTARRTHWTPGARGYHWNATKAKTDYEGSLYLATRHYAGWYMTNILELPAEDVAIALGHTDGGYLVRTLYGHRDHDRALQRVANAYKQRANVTPLTRPKEESA